MKFSEKFDVIVIGGGHAGTEAALAASKMGARTLLLTHNIETIGQMSCNPAIGGIGKGHLVKEIDALGGIMAKAIDQSGIQFRRLNASKGPAVQSTRAQADRLLYKQAIRKFVESQENLYVFQQEVEDIIISNNRVVAVKTLMGLDFYTDTVVLTAGTFLAGKIHIGKTQYVGGRAEDPAANGLAAKLRELPLDVARLKTGTPARLDARTIDFSKLEQQHSDNPLPLFSFEHSNLTQAEKELLVPRQIPCYITYTNETTHELIREGFADSPMYSGRITGRGPRYCPSIEDKITRFADKDRHQIFVEPEGLNVNEIYPNGLSTSLSFDTQLKFIRSIKGFENVHITRPGYAIEYDYFNPQGLYSSLESKYIENLFFAGQINGTTGYEEAAAQGIVAGINAALKVQGKQPWLPKRHECYIGVLIDDLITKGTIEPYRMFTSRAEYRLLLREDNADYRLTETGYNLGLIDKARFTKFKEKYVNIENEKSKLKSIWVRPDTNDAEYLNQYINNNISREYNLLDLLKRPEINYGVLSNLECFYEHDSKLQQDEIEQVEISVKYSGYIDRQILDINKQKKYENWYIPKDFDYNTISGLSAEVVEKLVKQKPETIGQASRISGITPAAISLLTIYLTKLKNYKKAV